MSLACLLLGRGRIGGVGQDWWGGILAGKAVVRRRALGLEREGVKGAGFTL